MSYGLPADTVRSIQNVLARYGQVDQAILYGSRAKGTQRRGSDIDLTLRGSGLTLRMLFRILDEIDDLLLPYTVDLSIFDHIDNPDLIDHIQRVGVTFYQRVEPVAEVA